MTLPDLPPAEKNCLMIYQAAKNARDGFLTLGLLLTDNKENAYWGSTAVDSFKDFVEMLGIGSYSWVTRLINLSQLVVTQLLTKEELEEIGVAKASLLLPVIRREELTDEILAVAKNGTFRELRQILGHKIDTASNHFVICPRCGEEFELQKFMIQERRRL